MEATSTVPGKHKHIVQVSFSSVCDVTNYTLQLVYGTS